MKKKNIDTRKIIIISMIFIICVIAIMYIFKIYKIDILKNVKEQNKKATENTDITVVDVTNIVTGSNINHEHVYKSMYDNIHHWNECTICHEKNNIVNHNSTTTWSLRI